MKTMFVLKRKGRFIGRFKTRAAAVQEARKKIRKSKVWKDPEVRGRYKSNPTISDFFYTIVRETTAAKRSTKTKAGKRTALKR